MLAAMSASHFIANERVAPLDGQTLPVIDPCDGQPFAVIARGGARDVDAAVRAARAAFEGAWGALSALERGRLMMKLSQALLDHGEELALLEARDTGKALGTARNDAVVLARYFEYYAGACDKLHGETLPYQSGYTVLTLREPHGVTGHILPWNYPLQVFGRSAGAALAAGNACIVKPAEDGSLSILKVAEIAAAAGFPAGAINVVTGLGGEAGAALSAHAGVDHLSFTGSTATGRLVAHAAAERHCPVVLELGGKSPQIVFADADLDAAAPVIVNAIAQNCGQTCSAGSRLLVERGAYEPLLDRLVARFRQLRSGPASLDPDMGPLVNRRQYEQVRAFLARAIADGLAVAAQGTVMPESPPGGFYQEAVLLRDVPPDHELAQREIFGPVLIAMPFESEAQAVRLANGTPYGLCAGIWTADGARQLRLARRLRCGQVFINNYGAGGGVELPFGGVKSSGHGREKGFEALLGFTTLKTIAIRHGV